MTRSASEAALARALDAFREARQHYEAHQFAAARSRMAEYRTTIDYRAFTQWDKRPVTDKPPRWTVVVVSYGTGAELLRCLDSIFAQQNALFDVVLVNNGNNDSIKPRLENYPLYYIEPPENLLPAEGRNIGAWAARGQYLAFIDDDGLIPPDYIQQGEKALADPLVIGARGKVVPKTPGGATNSHYDLGNKPVPSTFNLEGNMVIRRATMTAVGGFDPLVFGLEGRELALRCEGANPGHEILYWPGLRLMHDFAREGRLTNKRKRQALGRAYLESLQTEKIENPNGEANVNQPGISLILRAGGNLKAAEETLNGLASATQYKPLEVFVLFKAVFADHLQLTRKFAGRLSVVVLGGENQTLAAVARKARYEWALVATCPAKLSGAHLRDLAGQVERIKKPADSIRSIEGVGKVAFARKAQLVGLDTVPAMAGVEGVGDGLSGVSGRSEEDVGLSFNNALTKQTDSSARQKKLPLVSIVVPVYNKAKFLRATIRSVLSNGYENVELIFVDDASEDRSKEILKSYLKTENRVRLVEQTVNSGASVARNKGLEVSNGQYIFFLDADDIIVNGAIERLVVEAEKHQSDIVRGKITGRDEETGNRKKLAKENLLHNEYKPDARWQEDESLWYYWYFSANLYRRSFLVENCLFFPQGLRNEDPVFLCRCLLAAEKVTLLPMVVYLYTIGSEQKRKTPSYSFLRGWALSNYYLFLYIKNREVQANYFIANFSSVYAHTSNIVKTLPKRDALDLLIYLEAIFKSANLNWLESPESAPWSCPINMNKLDLEVASKFKNFGAKNVYDFIAIKEKVAQLPDVDSKKVTIIMPVHNACNWLLQSIGSVIWQTFRNWELIAVDDASEDESWEVLRYLSQLEKRIITVKNDMNLGKGASRNIGVSLATGDYVFFVDADDWLPREALESLVSVAAEDGAELVIGQIFKSRDGSVGFEEGDHKNYQHQVIRKSKAHEYPDLLDSAIACNKLLDVKFLRKANIIFNEDLRRFEDTDYAWKLWLQNPLVSLLNAPTYYYRQQASDTVDRSNRKEGGASKANYYRLKLIDSLVANLPTKMEQAVRILLSRLMLILVRQLRFSGDEQLKPNIILASEILSKIEDGFFDVLPQPLRSSLREIRDKLVIQTLDSAWEQIKPLTPSQLSSEMG